MVATFLFDLGLEDVYLTSVHKYGDNTLFYAATGIRREWKIRFEQVSKFVCIETDQLEAIFPEINAHTITGGALA